MFNLSRHSKKKRLNCNKRLIKLFNSRNWTNRKKMPSYKLALIALFNGKKSIKIETKVICNSKLIMLFNIRNLKNNRRKRNFRVGLIELFRNRKPVRTMIFLKHLQPKVSRFGLNLFRLSFRISYRLS